MNESPARRAHRWVVYGTAGALLAGCATTRPPYTPEAVRSWRTVDLVVDVSDPLPARDPAGPVPVIGATSSAALGVGVLFSLALFAMDQAATEEARAVQARMRPQLADLDLSATLQAEVLAHTPASLRGRLRSSDTKLPAADLGPAWDKALEATARNAAGDGMLAIRAWPMFRSPYVFPAVMVQARLLDRQGVTWESTNFTVLAPMAPGDNSEERTRWWESGHWRRFVLLALQSTAMGIAARMEPHPDAEAREARFVDLKARDSTLEIESSRLRASVCALAAEQRPLVHRYERLWKEVRIGTLCADEPGTRLPAGLDPVLAWTVPAPTPQAPVLLRQP